jgi:hypothetical protein
MLHAHMHVQKNVTTPVRQYTVYRRELFGIVLVFILHHTSFGFLSYLVHRILADFGLFQTSDAPHTACLVQIIFELKRTYDKIRQIEQNELYPLDVGSE